jgi:hypothetical protein
MKAPRSAPSVIVYELNEVPWAIVDFYVARRPRSALARLLARSATLTTVSEEKDRDLQPWRTWPTFHRSLWTRDHNSWDIGQDPDTFRGVDMWTVAARAGLRVGVFGALQSWPPRDLGAGSFYIPDTFARTAETIPPSLQRFQAFNLSMTTENRFAPTDRIGLGQLPVVGARLLHQGLTLPSAVRLVRHLAAERIDSGRRASRAVMQVVPAFDLFWRLVSRRNPALSLFFTNHVAAMLHRYWAEALPVAGGAQPAGLGPGGRLVIEALDLFDGQLARMVSRLDADPRTVLIVASGMGQAGVEKRKLGDVFVVESLDRLAATLELAGAVGSMGMYPAQAIELPDAASAAVALERLTSVAHELAPMFRQLRLNGRTVSFEVDYISDATQVTPHARFSVGGDSRSATLADLGISVRSRPGGGNTGEHVPEGIFICAGSDISPSTDRRRISLLDAAPSILAILGVAADASMRGSPVLG